jgi:hypothetical protein
VAEGELKWVLPTSIHLPIRKAQIVKSAISPPCLDADPAHRWLREMATTVCRQIAS